jgi:hypothetical protein
VAEALFPDGNAVGQVVRVNNVPFHVLGVLERKGGTTMGTDQDDQLVAPYTTVMKRVMGTTRIGIIYVAAVSSDAVAGGRRRCWRHHRGGRPTMALWESRPACRVFMLPCLCSARSAAFAAGGGIGS